jgi:hypothetical protein
MVGLSNILAGPWIPHRIRASRRPSFMARRDVSEDHGEKHEKENKALTTKRQSTDCRDCPCSSVRTVDPHVSEVGLNLDSISKPHQARTGKGIHGLRKVSCGPAMTDPYMPCGRATPQTAVRARRAGGLRPSSSP